MNENDLKPNSHRFKAEQTQTPTTPVVQKKTDKVIAGTAGTKKKSGIIKFAEVFIAEDIANVKDYLIHDLLIPTIKNTIEDLVTNSVSMLLRGTAATRRSNSRADHVSYSSISKNNTNVRSNNIINRTGYDYDDVVLTTRADAEAVLDRLGEMIETYGMVSVGDLYDTVGKTPQYTDYKYGWVNIRNAKPVRVRDGYILDMPKVSPLN